MGTMKKIEAMIRPGRLDAVRKALNEIGITGFTVTNVSGRGSGPEEREKWRGEEYVVDLYQKIKIESVVRDEQAESVVDAIYDAAHSGHRGDGKIFIIPVEDACQIRSGKRGDQAL